jgi:hypothetical protein
MRRAVAEQPVLLGLAVAVGGYALSMLVNFTNPTSTCLIAFVIGALISASPGAEPPWRSVTVSVVWGVTALLMFFGCVSEINLKRGIERASAGDLAGATHGIDQARDLRPGDADVDMLASQYLAQALNQGDISVAPITIAYAKHSLAQTPHTYDSMVALAAGYIAENRLRDALHILNEAIGYYPYRTSARVLRGITRYGLGQNAAALSDLHAALSLSPHDLAATTAFAKVSAGTAAAPKTTVGSGTVTIK